jgi:hypothetical protein
MQWAARTDPAKVAESAERRRLVAIQDELDAE